MSGAPIDLIRGDRFTFVADELLNTFENAVPFNDDDVFFFTIKQTPAKTDAQAYVQLRDQSRFTLDVNKASCTIRGVASDWTVPSLKEDTDVVWDFQLLVHGDPAEVVTIDHGEGVVRADSTRTTTPAP